MFLDYIKNRFRVVVIDTEFQFDVSKTYVKTPLCLCMKDLSTGHVYKYWDHESKEMSQHHFDFETISPPVPKYPGESPFNKFPFQYSLHIEYEDGKVIHKETLENPDTDGRENIARKITEHIPKDSCIVAFNSSFEMGVFEYLANLLCTVIQD